MTAETDLLPLPEYLRAAYKRMATDSHEAECKHYARANVARATAARDAEVDALRAEVEVLRISSFANASVHIGIERDRQKARADRLAEALREAKETMLSQVKWEACGCGCPQGRKPTDAVSVTWLRAVQQVEVATARAEEGK